MEALETTGLALDLADANFTLFAPTNEALSGLTPGVLHPAGPFYPRGQAGKARTVQEGLDVVTLDSGDRQEFTRGVLRGHLVPGWAPRHGWVDEGSLSSALPGAAVRINAFAGSSGMLLTANCAPIRGPQIKFHSASQASFERHGRVGRKGVW